MRVLLAVTGPTQAGWLVLVVTENSLTAWFPVFLTDGTVVQSGQRPLAWLYTTLKEDLYIYACVLQP